MGDTLEKILSELEMIRKIKMIELMDRGYSQSKLGNAIGMSQSTISRMMTGRKAASNTQSKEISDDE